MPRRKKEGVSFKRDVGVDTRYGSPVIQKLINVVMWRGKKNAARTIVYDAIDVLIKKSNGDKNKALELFFRALDQLVPHVEVRPRRVGGSVYQIPMEVNPDRARALAMRWLIGAAKSVQIRPWVFVLLMNCSMLLKAVVAQLKRKLMYTEWQKRTGRSLTMPGSN